jgi:hypothetical protein
LAVAEERVTYCTAQSDSSAEAVGVALLTVAEALVEGADAVMKVVGVAELDSLVLEGADEGDTEDEEADEGEAELATSASTTAALLLAEEEAEEESFPTPALVFKAVTSSAEVAFHTESAEPIASTAAVSVNEPKSPEPVRELI